MSLEIVIENTLVKVHQSNYRLFLKQNRVSVEVTDETSMISIKLIL